MDFSVWQVLPFHPVNMSNSPYESESAFAGNPLFIDPEELVRDGLISREDERSCVYGGSPYTADYAFAARTRDRVLRKAYENAGADVLSKVKEFADRHEWVRSYALYKALKNAEGELPWYEWRQELTDYNSASEYADGNETGYIEFVQYEFFRQWERIKSYAASRNIKILGDMPIYVSCASADVWSAREMFKLADPLKKKKQAENRRRNVSECLHKNTPFVCTFIVHGTKGDSVIVVLRFNTGTSTLRKRRRKTSQCR